LDKLENNPIANRLINKKVTNRKGYSNFVTNLQEKMLAVGKDWRNWGRELRRTASKDADRSAKERR
jgi:hypothetical protein